MINCQEATFLMAKKEEGKLSFMGRINLSIHTFMCSLCKKFEKQTSKIGKESRHIHGDDDLPEYAKKRMEKMLEDHLS